MDMTAIMRSDLKGNPDKHHNHVAGKALPATPFGLITQMGMIKDRRQSVLRDIVEQPACETPQRHQALRRELIKRQREAQKEDEIVVADAEFSPHELLEFGAGDFVLRCAKNDTFCRTTLKQRQGERGRACSTHEVVRPLLHKWKGRELPASEPDAMCEFVIQRQCKDKASGKQTLKRIIIKAKIWDDVRVNDTTYRQCVKKKLTAQQLECLKNTSLRVIVFEDPDFDTPWIIVTTLVAVDPAIIYEIYTDRWPVEGVPSVAKTILGGQRLFVYANEHVKRLPELLLLGGNILAVVAAGHEPIPTGFWDKQPKATAGRLRRLLSKVGIESLEGNLGQLCKKESVTGHLAAKRQAKRQQASAPSV